MGRSSERPNDSTLRGILDGALAFNRRSRTEVALRFSFKPTRSPRIPLADRRAKGALSVLAKWWAFCLVVHELSLTARVIKYAMHRFRLNSHLPELMLAGRSEGRFPFLRDDGRCPVDARIVACCQSRRLRELGRAAGRLCGKAQLVRDRSVMRNALLSCRSRH